MVVDTRLPSIKKRSNTMSQLASRLASIEQLLQNWMGLENKESFQMTVQNVPEEHIAVSLYKIECLARELRENLDNKITVCTGNIQGHASIHIIYPKKDDNLSESE